MRRITIVSSLLLFTLAFGLRSVAQESSNTQQPKAQDAAPAPEHFFHLDFVVEELNSDGKPVNSRSYSTTISTAVRTNMSIRTNSRLPVSTGFEAGGKESTSWQYQNVGVNFDVRNAREIGHQLAFEVTADVNALADSAVPNLHQPVIRENRWQASVVIPVGKSTAIFSSDSNDSKGSTRVLVTATGIQ